MATQYSINAINKSSQMGDICVFQTYPNTPIPNALSLAWFAKSAPPNTTQKFPWTIDYAFVWSETGTLVPGVIFDTAQMFSADLSNSNKVTFTNSGGQFTFTNQSAGPSPGNLYITEDSSIPMNQAAVGIGMSGAATLAVQASPNMNLTFSPPPQYWIAFGNYMRGQVLDVSRITQKAQVTFPSGVFSRTATFNANGTWTIT